MEDFNDLFTVIVFGLLGDGLGFGRDRFDRLDGFRLSISSPRIDRNFQFARSMALTVQEVHHAPDLCFVGTWFQEIILVAKCAI